MPWPSSAVNSGPRRFSQAPGITDTRRNSQPTCSTAFCSSPVGRPDLQSQAQQASSKIVAQTSWYLPPRRRQQAPRAHALSMTGLAEAIAAPRAGWVPSDAFLSSSAFADLLETRRQELQLLDVPAFSIRPEPASPPDFSRRIENLLP